MHLDDLMDTIIQKILIKWNLRKRIAKKFEGKILPRIVQKLRGASYNLDIEVITSSPDGIAEVCAKGSSASSVRFIVNTIERTCSCRAWQGLEIPCKHDIAYITSIPLEDYVDECYSVEKFKIAYADSMPFIPNKSMWPKPTHGFFMHPPLLKTTAGGRRKNRMKSSLEGGSSRKKLGNEEGIGKRQHKCPICHQLGHHWYTCKNGNPDDMAAFEAER
jgi:hypothetical protein